MGSDSEMGRKPRSGGLNPRKPSDLQKRKEAIERQEANLERLQVGLVITILIHSTHQGSGSQPQISSRGRLLLQPI